MQDLARWDENFYSGRVGGLDLLKQMQVKGRLNNGEQIGYASGLEIGEYLGLRTVEHGGGDAGFRTELLRFPDQHFSVIALCNAAPADPGALAHQVSDIYLRKDLHFKLRQDPRPPEVNIDPKLLDAYVGSYALDPAMLLEFTREGDRLITQATGQSKIRIYSSSETSFFLKEVDAQVQFDRPDASGRSPALTLHQGGDHRAMRVEKIELTPQRMQPYEGTYYSDELDTLYTLSNQAGKLSVRTPRAGINLEAVTPDVFVGEFPLGTVQFSCKNPKRCDGFSVSNGRVLNLRFNRVNLQPAS